jgi:predicted CopG family antitoxin
MAQYSKTMLHELTITVDDAVYQTLKPMVEQQTIGAFLSDILQTHSKDRQSSSIRALRGSLRRIDTSNIREETDRIL